MTRPEEQATPAADDDEPESSGWSGLQKTIGAITGLVVAIGALVAGLHQAGILGHDSEPAKTIGTTETTETTSKVAPALFRGFILRQPNIEVRADPELLGRVVGFLAHNTEVFIVCTAIGDQVQGPGAGANPPTTTPLWDKVRTRADGDDLGFVPDAWVKTGTTAPLAPGC